MRTVKRKPWVTEETCIGEGWKGVLNNSRKTRALGMFPNSGPHNSWGKMVPAHGQMEGFQDPGWNREMRHRPQTAHDVFKKRFLERRWTVARNERLNDEQRWQG